MADVLTGKSPFKEQAQEYAQQSGIADSAEEILGPFSEMAAMVADSLWNAGFPSSSTNSLHWPYLLVTVVLCIALWKFRRGRGAKDADGVERPMNLLSYLFPRRIYTHRSARVDIGLYFIDAMLHTHHSVLEKHWGTNLASVTSIWDRLFGTIYIPAKDEETPWGLPPEDQIHHSSLKQNLLGPFREIYALVRGDGSSTAGSSKEKA